MMRRIKSSPLPPRNIDANGKTRPTTTKGIATPKTKVNVEEAEDIIKGDAKNGDEAESKGID